ncbi:glycosyltransferase family 4 protein [Gelidibacter mesophilus]|uniref:glycosyltransferase family 4 protein n=1 Tax=Gelidibacter mesophilus TaxID=169050 RepID=UPI0003FBCDE4|nr:glycosyltransferase family 4 protein [Gelidibacter mesophilus]
MRSVAFITSEYPHPKVKHAAGIGTSIKNLAEALAEKGLAVHVFVYHQDTDDIINDARVTLHLISSKKFRIAQWFFYRKHIQNHVNKAIVRYQIQIVEAPDWTGITAFMKFKVPLVIRLHGTDAYFCHLEKRPQKFKNFMFEKLALNGAKGFIAPTNYAGQLTAGIFSLRNDTITTIHHGLKMEDFENNAPAVFKRNTILYIGTIIRKKGVLELAQIFNKVLEVNEEAELVLIGSDAPDIQIGTGSTYALMEQHFSEKAKRRVRYLGRVAYNEVQEHIKNAHVCVFPSFAETLGMVTIESMALKKPVVNTNIGWAKELIDDGRNGFLEHPSNFKQYAEKIEMLLKDETLCQQMGEAARKKVELQFDIIKQAQTTLEYYNTIVL